MTDIRQELLALQAQVVALTRSVYVADTQAIAARKSAEAAEAEVARLTGRLVGSRAARDNVIAERDALAAEIAALREAAQTLLNCDDVSQHYEAGRSCETCNAVAAMNAVLSRTHPI